jgi:hypothetical protein
LKVRDRSESERVAPEKKNLKSWMHTQNPF